ncbi:hypothetical protein PILCRDRAFT_13997 [Piloderma croceum F 1598]|uniref:Uncharacterized protein n=1 Tax=Piloderma croceum (strain F 1598) TaxID=765440 RepID=A0A0C3BC81_PILCF|nr:hypothetical protein PILCRDRAFT_13997 [Piloderma croceum F 1598]
MAWIFQHWDEEYITNAEQIIKTTMLEYHERIKERAGPITSSTTTNPTHLTQVPAYMFLAKQYGLDDMELGASEDVETQMVEQEYQDYITASISVPVIRTHSL